MNQPAASVRDEQKKDSFGAKLAKLLSDFSVHYMWEKKWFFIAMIVGAIMLSLPVPDGLSREAWIVLTMSLVATILFVTEPIPLPAVALLIILGQVLLLGSASSDVAKSLWNDSVLFIMGSLMLAVAVVKQKLDKRMKDWKQFEKGSRPSHGRQVLQQLQLPPNGKAREHPNCRIFPELCPDIHQLSKPSLIAWPRFSYPLHCARAEAL